MITALGFLTIFGGARVPRARTTAYFPVAGALIGLCIGGIWWAASQVWSPVVAAGVAVSADLIITGMLHLDGLADSADGLLPHLDRERRLAVMSEPTIGAFALGTVVMVLILRWSALASLTPTGAPVLLVAALWCVSRTLMGGAVRALPYARGEGGLASAFGGPGGMGWVAGPGLILTLALALPMATRLPLTIVAIAAAIAAGAAVLAFGVRRLGGYTGDVLGAAGMIAETVGLLVASARW